MLAPRFPGRIGKMFALLAATLMLPSLANSQFSDLAKKRPPPSCPEVNAVCVLVPVAGAILFFSARKQFPRRKG
jgi:hypothetical protein